jgi:retinol dehydrogenase-12
VVCKSLAKHNPSHIYIAARNSNTAESTISEIKSLAPKVEVTFVGCNLALLSSVEKAARIVILTTARLDLLFRNADILGAGEGPPPGLTEDGYEIQFGVNHLGYALLVKLLLPTLLKTAELHPDVRVIINTSAGYRFHASQGIAFKDLRTRQENLTLMGGFGGWLRYFQSKLANVVYNDKLARRYPSIKFVAIQ